MSKRDQRDRKRDALDDRYRQVLPDNDPLDLLRSPVSLNTLSDDRLFNPTVRQTPRGPIHTVFDLLGRQARVVAPARGPLANLHYHTPQVVTPCVRRAQRKEVLHALGLTGKGSGGGRKHYNANSRVRCK